jgi:hypothetical protein
LRINQRHADDGISPAERGIHQAQAKTVSAQGVNSRRNGGITLEYRIGDLWQGDAFGDDAIFHIALEHLRQALGACFVHRIAGGQAIADIQIPYDIGGEIYGFVIADPGIGQGADPIGLCAIEIDPVLGSHAHFIGQIMPPQRIVQQPVRTNAGFLDLEPTLTWIVDTPLRSRAVPVEVPKKVLGRQTFDKFAQCCSQSRFLASALAIGKQDRAFFVPNVHRPAVLHRIQPAGFLDRLPGLDRDGSVQHRQVASVRG